MLMAVIVSVVTKGEQNPCRVLRFSFVLDINESFKTRCSRSQWDSEAAVEEVNTEVPIVLRRLGSC
jgi:hypothetical protein